MKIVCPQCAFSRDVNPRQFKKDTVIANCPQCGCRFRLAIKTGECEILPPKGWTVLQGKPQAVPEEEEDIREVARRAYEREARRFQEPEKEKIEPQHAADTPVEEPLVKPPAEESDPGPDPNPWETAPGRDGWFAAFYQTVIRVMFSAQAFFSRLSPQSQQIRPLLFYLVICAFQTATERFWGMTLHNILAPGAADDPQLEMILSMLAPDGNFALGVLIRCGLLVLQIYIFSFLMFLVYRLLNPQRATFSLIFQVMAYSTAPAMLCIVPVLGSVAGLFWSLGCMAIGCKSALNLTWPQTLAGFVPLLLIFAPVLPEILNIIQK